MSAAFLLPAGFRDLLPGEAAWEAGSVARLLAVFESHGYERTDPPLMEFEDGFAIGTGAAVSDACFRLLDPDSHRMMVLRADITPQIARIAASRLASVPRPLRLAYQGDCVRIRGGQIDPDRQVRQVGIELLGPDCAAADAEVMAVGIEALAAVGLDRISLDLTLPALVPVLLDEAGFAGERRGRLERALDRKDAAGIAEAGGTLAALLGRLLRAAGAAPAALAALGELDLPASCHGLVSRLREVVALLQAQAPGARLTVDPVEFRGWRYHAGIAVTVFAPGRHEELGRGGRYTTAQGESGTGFTLYADAVLRAAPAAAPAPRLYLPRAHDRAAAARLRAEGWRTVAWLEGSADDEAAARALRCGHILDGGRPRQLGPA